MLMDDRVGFEKNFDQFSKQANIHPISKYPGRLQEPSMSQILETCTTLLTACGKDLFRQGHCRESSFPLETF
jgi:hypothetical protein